MLYMNYPRCGDCAFSASFVRECTYVSYIAREGVELTVHKEGVVVEEIKEVELRSRRAQFIYDRNYNRIELRRRGHAPSITTSVTQTGKSKGFLWNSFRKISFSYYSSEYKINSTTTTPKCTLP